MEKRRERMNNSASFDGRTSTFYDSIKGMGDNNKRTINNIPVTTGMNAP